MASAVASTKAQASAAIEAAHAKIVHLLPEGMVDVPDQQRERIHATIRYIFQPQLHPLLAPLPGICRLIAFLIVAPVIVLCLTDFAGYAIFRTLGFRRRRVRVKRGASVSAVAQPALSPAAAASAISRSGAASPSAGAYASDGLGSGPTSGASSPTAVRAPLLAPGAYDAETLLRHRARSISSQSEAEEEWARTGGQFARVSTVRASQAAAAAAAAATSTNASPSPVPPHAGTAIPSIVSPPDSPRHAFARARNVGVEGALGYSDTDADDSGAESGQSSPVIGRKPWQKRGLSSSKFNFTPVTEPDASFFDQSHDEQHDDPTSGTLDSATASLIGLKDGVDKKFQ